MIETQWKMWKFLLYLLVKKTIQKFENFLHKRLKPYSRLNIICHLKEFKIIAKKAI